MDFEGLDAVNIVEVQEVERSHRSMRSLEVEHDVAGERDGCRNKYISEYVWVHMDGWPDPSCAS